jgi:bidirectional [NiFe] hydrogenase diaphorase subunit
MPSEMANAAAKVMPTALSEHLAGAAAPGRQPFEALEPILRRYHRSPDSLIETLNQSQELYGHLSDDLLRHVARSLELPLSGVYGTASFYHLFRFQPPARHCCLVCTGTACHVLGAAALLAALEHEPLQERGIELGSVRCIGTCSGAPLVVVDGQVLAKDMEAVLLEPLAFFLPQAAADPSQGPGQAPLWVEVTLPQRGSPLPIRLGRQRNGAMVPLPLAISSW